MKPIFPANPSENVGFYGGRIAEGLFGEPLNVLSDICFIIFIVLYFLKLRKDGSSDGPIFILVFLAGLVGLGSAIFHSHPTKNTLQIDLIPITIFGLAFISFCTRRFFNQTYFITILAPIIFLLVTLGFEEITNSLRIPGLNHIPSILALAMIGLLLRTNPRLRQAGNAFLFASGCYVAAMFFRYLDLYIYEAFPLGTHFLWHGFTFAVVIILLHTVNKHGKEIQGNGQKQVI